MKCALITGITGQDGSYLAELLLQKGYSVWGTTRAQGQPNPAHLRPFLDPIQLLRVDLLDQRSLLAALEQSQPDEVYNLAAQSLVSTSWNEPIETGELTGMAVTRLLEAIRQVNPRIRFFQASSSEMFGRTQEYPQNEQTAFHPRSPYGVAKAYGHWITVNYRESYNLFACSGISFNHESPRRPPQFVSRKISLGVARIKLCKDRKLRLGNLEVRRDWGFAGDYVKAMWLMLQQEKPEDFVLATGVSHSVRDWVNLAFGHVGLDPYDHVALDPGLLRPADIEHLVGNPSKAWARLGWKAETSFEDLVPMMVEEDLRRVREGLENGSVA